MRTRTATDWKKAFPELAGVVDFSDEELMKHCVRMGVLREYLRVDCPFCLVMPGQPCVKLYSKKAGEWADFPHVRRAYRFHAYMRLRNHATS